MTVFLSKIGFVRFLLLHGQLKKGGQQWWVICRRSMLLWSATLSTSEKGIRKCYFNNVGYPFKSKLRYERGKWLIPFYVIHHVIENVIHGLDGCSLQLIHRDT